MESLRQKLHNIGVSQRRIEQIEAELTEGKSASLVHEIILRGMWQDVVDETSSRPEWIDTWLALGKGDFPFINTDALERLVSSGVDVEDLTDVVRSAQILTIYNIANLLDNPNLGQLTGNFDDDEGEFSLYSKNEGHAYEPLYELHSSLMDYDPSRRYGEPRSLALRQLENMPEEIKAKIKELISDKKFSLAAALWKKQVGGELSDCLAIVKAI